MTKWNDEMPARAKAHLSEGYSKAATAGMLGISNDTFHTWVKEKADFSDAIKEGERQSQKWWEDKGRAACSDPANGVFNAAVWIFNMKNRFGWRDRHEIGGGDDPLVIELVRETRAESDAWINGVLSDLEGPEKGDK